MVLHVRSTIMTTPTMFTIKLDCPNSNQAIKQQGTVVKAKDHSGFTSLIVSLHSEHSISYVFGIGTEGQIFFMMVIMMSGYVASLFCIDGLII